MPLSTNVPFAFSLDLFLPLIFLLMMVHIFLLLCMPGDIYCMQTWWIWPYLLLDILYSCILIPPPPPAGSVKLLGNSLILFEVYFQHLLGGIREVFRANFFPTIGLIHFWIHYWCPANYKDFLLQLVKAQTIPSPVWALGISLQEFYPQHTQLKTQADPLKYP